MSSVVIVGRTERVQGANTASQAPLYFGDMLLYPNLGDPISKSTNKEVSFYVAFYPAGGRALKQAAIELLHNGQPLATAPLTLPAADGGERIQHVGRLPLDTVPPGTYELRIRVSDDRHERSQSAFFTVES
jgi:hypothetical protein